MPSLERTSWDGGLPGHLQRKVEPPALSAHVGAPISSGPGPGNLIPSFLLKGRPSNSPVTLEAGCLGAGLGGQAHNDLEKPLCWGQWG